jgi:hypothetical protein
MALKRVELKAFHLALAETSLKPFFKVKNRGVQVVPGCYNFGYNEQKISRE